MQKEVKPKFVIPNKAVTLLFSKKQIIKWYCL